ncbi:MAG: putative molybdenum carrier protein [Steroidobacteraceae bacterium]
MVLTKVVSGGQTGVDRGALDAALAAGFLCGGWCPVDRRAEDGPIPQRYPLIPLPGAGYREHTRQNVIDSDATAILFYQSLAGGTLLTRNLCVRQKIMFTVINAQDLSASAAAAMIVQFIEQNAIQALNIAGPRASGWEQGYGFAVAVLGEVIKLTPSI